MKTKHKVILGVSIGATILAAGAGTFTYLWFKTERRSSLLGISCTPGDVTFEGHHYSAIVDGELLPMKEPGEQIGYVISGKDEKKFVKKNPGVRYGITENCIEHLPKPLYLVEGVENLEYICVGVWPCRTLQRID